MDYWTVVPSHAKNVEFLQGLADKEEERIRDYRETLKKEHSVDSKQIQSKFWKFSDVCYTATEDGKNVKIVTYRGIFTDSGSNQILINFDAYSDGRVKVNTVPPQSYTPPENGSAENILKEVKKVFKPCF